MKKASLLSFKGTSMSPTQHLQFHSLARTLSSPIVVDEMAPQKCPPPIPGICEYVKLYGKWDLAEVNKVTDVKRGRLFRWGQLNPMSP